MNGEGDTEYGDSFVSMKPFPIEYSHKSHDFSFNNFRGHDTDRKNIKKINKQHK